MINPLPVIRMHPPALIGKIIQTGKGYLRALSVDLKKFQKLVRDCLAAHPVRLQPENDHLYRYLLYFPSGIIRKKSCLLSHVYHPAVPYSGSRPENHSLMSLQNHCCMSLQNLRFISSRNLPCSTANSPAVIRAPDAKPGYPLEEASPDFRQLFLIEIFRKHGQILRISGTCGLIG